MTDTAYKILELIKQNNKITLDEIMKMLCKDRRTISRNIKSLKENGILKRIGSDKNGYWEVTKK